MHRPSSPVTLEMLESRTLLSATVPLAPALWPTEGPGTFMHEGMFGPSVVGQLAATTPDVVSTPPSNGDLNPYGLAYVPENFRQGGPLRPGDLLVSNFNNSSNLQGTGTTIDRITPSGQVSTFFQGVPGLGLTTALGILPQGYIVVGNMPTTDGTSATVQPGSLLIIDRFGHQVGQIADPNLINGPWDLTVHSVGPFAQIFVANVLSGTVSRFDVRADASGVRVLHSVQIASGYGHRSDPAALELGPTGLAFDARTGTLFVASALDNEIFAVAHAGFLNHDAGTGTVAVSDQMHLHGPLGLVLAPNGDLIVANGDAINADPAQPSEIVEFTQTGAFVAQASIDTNADAPFGIALTVQDGQLRFAAVNDNQNIVNLWTLPGGHDLH